MNLVEKARATYEGNSFIQKLADRIEELERELAAVRELMNCYNLGGWTDALEPMQRAIKAEAELAEVKEAVAFDPMNEAYLAGYNAAVAALKAPASEPVTYEFQGRDGKWYPFIDHRHYLNTLNDGSWPIRALYTAPPNTDELVKALRAIYSGEDDSGCIASLNWCQNIAYEALAKWEGK